MLSEAGGSSSVAALMTLSIIAVTGLAGHPIGSWALPDSQMWLRDFIPHDIPNARVLTYGYDARIQGRDLPISTLAELAEEFLARLITMRRCMPQVSNDRARRRITIIIC
jgi:hypothetical protein